MPASIRLRPFRLLPLAALLLCLLPAALLAAPAATTDSSLVWKVPGDVPEMMAACKDIPALYNFSRNGYLSIECGYQAILFGSKVPIAPAAHIPWARPYGKGPLKVLAICSFGNGPADTAQICQVARELDCDMRFVLIADVPIAYADAGWGGRDEAYRLGYLAEQARTALKEDYDVILLAYGSYSPGFGAVTPGPVFPDDVYQTILEKTKAGTGLIFVGSNLGGWWINKTPLLEASPATMEGGGRRVPVPEIKAGPDLKFLEGAALSDMPLHKEGTPAYQAMAVYDWKPREGSRVAATESGKPLVVCGQYGQGRTVVLGWDGTLTPVTTRGDRLQYEHGLATTLRAIAYAAGKEPPVAVVPQATQCAAGVPGPVPVTLSGPAQLNWTVRSADFDTLAEGKAAGEAGDYKLQLPALPGGKLWLDVIARDGKGASVGWGSAPLTVTSGAQLLLATDKQSYRPGDTVHLVGSLNNSSPERTAQVEIRDASGRVLASGPATGQAKLTYDYRIADARVAPHTAIVTVYQGKNALLREKTTFFVPNNEWTDYENILWPNSPGELSEAARDAGGITAAMDSWGGDETGKAGAPFGIRPARMNDGVITPADLQVDPAAGDANQKITEAVAAAQKYGAVCWAFQDERGTGGEPPPPNEKSLAAFRAYLQAQYKTLDALNACWGTAHTDWNTIPATLTKDLTPQTKNLAPWVDFRLYVAEQMFQADKRHADQVRAALGPQSYIGVDGFTTSGHMIPYGGIDIGRYLATGVFNFYCPYGDDLMIASMLQGPMVKYIGWGMGKPTYFGYPWRDALRGQWGTFRFMGLTFFSQFGYLQPAGGWIGEGTQQLREGVGKALMGAKRELSPVAILYSYPSMITSAAAGAWIEGEKGNDHLMYRPANWSREAFERELVQSGVSFGYVTDSQVLQGGLAGKKLLIIPHFMGMSLNDATCAAIKQFVADGGMVVADLIPAICDEHGKLREKGGLDDLFGVSHTGFQYGQRAADYLVGVTKEDPIVSGGWWIGEWYEKSLKVTDGTQLGNHWFLDIPAFVTKKTGKGETLLMNFLQSTTVKRNGQPEDDDLKMIQVILRAAGITPPVDITDAAGVSLLKGYEINTLKDGPVDYLGVYCETTPENPDQMTVVFPEARETYDVRAGKYLGRVKQAAIPIKAFGAALFARCDYQITGLTVTTADAARGAVVPLAVKLACKGTNQPGPHVVRLEVVAPDGKRSFFYSQNVNTKNGAWQGEIHTALNDQPGTWKVNAREVLSGTTTTTQFRLK